MPKSTRKESARKPRARTAGNQAPRSPVDLEETIRRRAYQIAQERGAPGDPVQDWLRAERELLGGENRP